MEDKKQDLNSLEELVKEANAYSGWFANLADELSKVLADIKALDEEENTWEMKCPYRYNDEYFYINTSGNVFNNRWCDFYGEEETFAIGNIFPTRESALLEVKRRNLLTRFRAFRDECNDGWEPNFSNNKEKYYLFYSTAEDCIKVVWIVLGCSFNIFGYFKNKEDAERANELFGDEIKALFVDCEEV